MVCAVSLFSCLDTVAKLLVDNENLPVEQVTWVRFFVQFLLLLILVPATKTHTLQQLWVTNRLLLQLLRSVLMALTTLFNFLAIEHLRLDQTITIMFLAPVVVALIAGPVLGEWIGWRRLLAVMVGFVGVVVAVNPAGDDSFTPAVWYSFAAMAALAWFMLVTRQVAPYDPPLITLFYSMFAGVALGWPFAIAVWEWPQEAWHWLALLSLGVFGGAGHFMFILAYRAASASKISPFVYLQVPTMALLGFLVFDDQPTVHTAVGAAIIIASGIYLMHHERQRETTATASKSAIDVR
ncbi:MAG: DMT family transporter [Pseudomonadota bacterium]